MSLCDLDYSRTGQRNIRKLHTWEVAVVISFPGRSVGEVRCIVDCVYMHSLSLPHWHVDASFFKDTRSRVSKFKLERRCQPYGKYFFLKKEINQWITLSFIRELFAPEKATDNLRGWGGKVTGEVMDVEWWSWWWNHDGEVVVVRRWWWSWCGGCDELAVVVELPICCELKAPVSWYHN